MKKICLILMCMLFTTFLFAIDITVGCAAGVNTSFMTGSDWDDLVGPLDNSIIRVGFEAGAFSNIAINEFFAIQPELNFLLSRYGFGKEREKYTETIKMFEIPVLAKLCYKDFFVLLGPALQIILGDVSYKQIVGDKEMNSGTHEVDNSIVFSGVFGIGRIVPVGNGFFSADIRYRRQFTEMFEDFNAKLNNITFRVGYGYGL